jgi:hypothetical protein
MERDAGDIVDKLLAGLHLGEGLALVCQFVFQFFNHGLKIEEGRGPLLRYQKPESRAIQ